MRGLFDRQLSIQLPRVASACTGQSRTFIQRIVQACIGWTTDVKKLQFDKDLHNLFLLTSIHEHLSEGGDNSPDAVAQTAEKAGAATADFTTEDLFQRVNRGVCLQLLAVAEAMAASTPHAPSHLPATHAGDPSAPSPHNGHRLGRGHAPDAALRGPQSSAAAPADAAPDGESVDSHVTETKLFRTHRRVASEALRRWLPGVSAFRSGDGRSRDQLCADLVEPLGFRLDVRPSSIQHPAAGHGLWLTGSALYGRVVALHPGVVYPQVFHREMADYPNVTKANDYILSRYDGALIDARPWGRGRVSDDSPWPERDDGIVDAALRLLDGRHPLALGHYLNHPPAGVTPNVALAPFDLTLDGCPHLRPYLPYVTCDVTPAGVYGARVVGLALVAKRPLKDEELFVDYRLNPHAADRPDWYTPCDKLAERRRWGG